MVFEGAKLNSCSVGIKWLYLTLPKMGIVKVRHHRPLPDGAILKSIQVIKKTDGWYINLRLKDDSIPEFKPDIVPTWSNSLGMDAVLHEDDYLATSEGLKLPSLKSFRKSQNKLAKVSQRKSGKRKGSKARRQLAKKEAKLHQKIARSRKDHAYNTAQQLLATGKQVFFHEKLNLKGLSRKNRPQQDESGQYIPNGQSAKSGLNKSWADAGFGQFFEILKYKAEKAGAVVIPVNPQYTSQCNHLHPPPQKSDQAWKQAELTSAASSEPKRLTQSELVKLVMFERSLMEVTGGNRRRTEPFSSLSNYFGQVSPRVDVS